MLVSSVISAGIGFEGSLKDEKTSVILAINPVIRQIFELHHRKLDDFILRGVETRSFDVDEDADPGRLPLAGSKLRTRGEPAKYPIIGRLRQHLGHCG